MKSQQEAYGMHGASYEMLQTERTKDMVLEIVKPCFFEFDDWPVEILEHTIASELDPSEILEDMFRFRTVLTNFLQGCPYQLIDHVYYT